MVVALLCVRLPDPDLPIIAYSGAVVLLQKSEFRYHFSGRLRPWVHFVPLSYSMAELTSVVEFLQANDALAKQLALVCMYVCMYVCMIVYMYLYM